MLLLLFVPPRPNFCPDDREYEVRIFLTLTSLLRHVQLAGPVLVVGTKPKTCLPQTLASLFLLTFRRFQIDQFKVKIVSDPMTPIEGLKWLEKLFPQHTQR